MFSAHQKRSLPIFHFFLQNIDFSDAWWAWRQCIFSTVVNRQLPFRRTYKNADMFSSKNYFLNGNIINSLNDKALADFDGY